MAEPSNFMSLDDFEEPNNVIVFSEPGVGKTVWGKDADLLVRMDPGTESAKKAGGTARVANCLDWPTLIDTMNYIADHPTDYPIVFYDSLTRMHRLAMKWKMEQVSKANPAKRDIDLPDKPEYQWVQNVIKRYVEKLCDLPNAAVFSAITMPTETPGGTEQLLPQIHGQSGDLSRYLCSLMTAVGFMEVKELKVRGSDAKKPVRRIHWQPYDEGLYYGKDRTGALGEHTDNVDIRGIIQLMEQDNKPAPARKTPARRTRRRAA